MSAVADCESRDDAQPPVMRQRHRPGSTSVVAGAGCELTTPGAVTRRSGKSEGGSEAAIGLGGHDIRTVQELLSHRDVGATELPDDDGFAGGRGEGLATAKGRFEFLASCLTTLEQSKG